jgi:hypothetical protein
MMTYGEFLLCYLLRDNNKSFNELEYDTMFQKSKEIYIEYGKSTYNNTKKSEYDCIYEFLINSKYYKFKFE